MRLKTYEGFFKKNFFNKDYRPDLIEHIMNLAKKIFDTQITIQEIESASEPLRTMYNLTSKVISIKRKYSEQWCHLNYEVNEEIDIWFSPTSKYILSDYIHDILLQFGEKNTWGVKIKNKDIPEIVKKLTIKNYEEFESMKKYNL